MNGIHWRIIAAAIAKPELLSGPRSKMLATLSEQFGFTISRNVIDKPLMRPGREWLSAEIANRLKDAGHSGFRPADLKSVETVLKALAKRLLPQPGRVMCAIGTIEIDLEGRRLTMLGHQFRLYPTATGKLRIEGEDAKVPLEALLALVEEANRKGKRGRRAA
jgi:hypothetical protein